MKQTTWRISEIINSELENEANEKQCSKKALISRIVNFGARNDMVNGGFRYSPHPFLNLYEGKKDPTKKTQTKPVKIEFSNDVYVFLSRIANEHGTSLKNIALNYIIKHYYGDEKLF